MGSAAGNRRITPHFAGPVGAEQKGGVLTGVFPADNAVAAGDLEMGRSTRCVADTFYGIDPFPGERRHGARSSAPPVDDRAVRALFAENHNALHTVHRLRGAGNEAIARSA